MDRTMPYFARLTVEHTEIDVSAEEMVRFAPGTVVCVYAIEGTDAMVEVEPQYHEATTTYLRLPLGQLTRLCDICEEEPGSGWGHFHADTWLCTDCAQSEREIFQEP